MNSCLYETEIMHHRLAPREHRFAYRFFSFYLDLDEIDELTRRIVLMSRNKFNVYGFYDCDHMGTPGHSVKDNLLMYFNENGIDFKSGGRIMLLTYLRTCGYVFNPVSFYYCFDEKNNPLCVVPEIGNTFGELKPFLVRKKDLHSNQFKNTQDKLYYISPFTRLDDQLDFRLTIPDERLNICIDTTKNNQKIILTTMTGQRRELTNRNLLRLTLQFPLVTTKVIALIHWHAFRLWLKRIPYQEKTTNPHLQKEVFRAWSKDNKNAGCVHP